MTGSPEFLDWLQRAKDADIKPVADRLGARLKKSGAVEWSGPCPLCGGDDRFSINTKKQVFNCRGSEGGGVINMVMHVHQTKFIEACAFVLDEDPPKRNVAGSGPDREIMRERRDERRDAAIVHDMAAVQEIDEAVAAATDLFRQATPIEGTWAEDYLLARGIGLRQSQTADLGLVPNLPYWGYRDGDSEAVEELGAWHCMVAAIRDVDGRIIGVHRTYLDARNPVKLAPPGDRKRNKAKKVFRKAHGGLIRLGPIGAVLAIGEGIETTASWYGLGFGPDDVTIAAGISLVNMAGGAAGTVEHPERRGRTIFNGEPDMERPGMIIPPGVRTLILLGDGDSDPDETKAKILTGARRFRAQGIETLICFAPAGQDWNDVMRARAKDAA